MHNYLLGGLRLRKFTFKLAVTYFLPKFVAISLPFWCFLAFETAAYAQVATWNSTSGTGSTGVTAGTATLGGGLTSTSVAACGNSVFTVVDIFDTGDPSPTTAADAISDDEYIEFPITANAGYTVTISSVQFSGQKSNTGGNNTGLYNGTTDISSGGITWTGTGCGTRTIDNTDVEIASGSTVTFRLYVWGSTGSTGSWRVGSVQFIGSVLPVSLTTFEVKPGPRGNFIRFQTASERNNAYFSIERSADGNNFSEIGRLRGNGNSTALIEYTFTDNYPVSGINYYRLKQVDFDDRFEYSKVVAVQMGNKQGFSLAPVPAYDRLTLRFDERQKDAVAYDIFDAQGRLLQSGLIPEDSESVDIEVGELSFGHYTLRVQTAGGVMVKAFQK